MPDHVMLLFWFIITAIVNVLMRTKTAAQWDALARKNSRYAALARMLRAVGVDPVKFLQGAIDIVRGEAQLRTEEHSQASHKDSAAKHDKPVQEREKQKK
jgi:hypothetical protein